MSAAPDPMRDALARQLLAIREQADAALRLLACMTPPDAATPEAAPPGTAPDTTALEQRIRAAAKPTFPNAKPTDPMSHPTATAPTVPPAADAPPAT